MAVKAPAPADHDDLRSGVIAGASAYLLWGLLTLYWKLLKHFNAFDLIGWRIVSASIAMAALLTCTRRWAHLRPLLSDHRLVGRVALAAALLTVNWTSYVWAVVHGHIIETALGYFMAPLGTILIGVAVFGEHLRAAQRFAVFMAVAAIAVLTVSYGRVPWLSIAIAVSWSLYGWMKKQVPLTPLESMSAESLLLLGPAIVVIIVLSGSATSVISSATTGTAVLVALSGLATVVPLMLFAWAAPRVPLTVLGPMQYMVPTINFLLGWLVYDEALPVSRVVGFAFVWVGLVVVTADTMHRASLIGRSVSATNIVTIPPGVGTTMGEDPR